MPHGSPNANSITRWFGRPRAHLFTAVLGVVLVLPSISSRLVLDDHVLALKLSDRDHGVEGLGETLFHFTTGRSEDNRKLIDQGVLLPWWSDEGHLNGFFRPLSSWTHRLDFDLFDGDPVWMHIHSILWLWAMFLVVAHLYRRLAPDAEPDWPPWVVGLSFLLFAVDDAHGSTVGWIANRNAIVAATLALPALGAHHRYRTLGWTPGAFIGPVCFGLGLLAGETAVAVFGYLIAHALVIDRGPLARRLLSLVPYLLLIAAWRVVFEMSGLGSAGSGAYHDPGRDPLGYVTHLSVNLPVLLSAQLGAPLADTAFWANPSLHSMILIASVATLVVLGLLAWPLLRRDRTLGFWTAGMVLSACAVAASLPGERLLLVVGVGAAPLMARLIVDLWQRAGGARLYRVAATLLVLAHVVVAAATLPLRARAMEYLGAAVDRAEASIPTSGIRFQQLIIVNAPFDVMASYIQVSRAARGVRRPAQVRWLATASSEITVTRMDDQVLRVTPSAGYLSTPPERHYRADPAGLGVGAVVRMTGVTATVAEVTGDGRPSSVDFRFEERLDSGRYRFVRWQQDRFVPMTPPTVGQSVRFPAEDFFRIVLQEMLR